MSRVQIPSPAHTFFIFMKVEAKIIKQENASVLLDVEVDKNHLQDEFNKVLQEYQNKAAIPGFRKGKVPADIIKTKFKNNINDDVLNNIIPKAYSEAVNITEITPYTAPEIKIESFDQNNLKFKANVQLKPEVELSSYKNLTFHKDEYKITHKDIEKELQKLQEKFADYILKDDKKLQDNDCAVLQVEAYDEGKNKIDELSNENHKIELNKSNIYEEFYKNIIGLKIGDEKEFCKEYPSAFNNKSLAGKKVTFKIKVKEVQEKKLPDLDDNFAGDVGDYKSLDELKSAIENQLKSMLENQLIIRFEKSIIEKIADSSKFKIPEKLIADRSGTLLNDFKNNLQKQGHDFQKMLEQKFISKEKITGEIRQQAVKDLKEYLIIIKIVELENIKVNDSEIDDFIKEEAVKAKQDFDEYRKKLNKDIISYIKHDLLTKKVMGFLKENNKIKKGKTYKMEDILKESEQKK